MNRVTTTETQDETPFQTTDATRYEHRPDPTRPDPTRFFSTYVCMHLPTPVVESANFVMHASSLTYTGETPTLHAESSTIEHLDFEVECSVRRCDRVAAWTVTLDCCGSVLPYCDPCKRVIDGIEPHKFTGVCRDCEAALVLPDDLWDWRAL